MLNFNLTWVYQSDLIYPKGQSWSILWPSISEHQLLICSGCDPTPRASGVNTKRDPCRFRTSMLKRKLHKALPLFVTSPLPIFHLSCGLMMREDVEFGVSGWIRVPSIYCLCLFFRNVWMWIPPPAGHWLNFCSSCASFPQISVKQVVSVQVKKKVFLTRCADPSPDGVIPWGELTRAWQEPSLTPLRGDKYVK